MRFFLAVACVCAVLLAVVADKQDPKSICTLPKLVGPCRARMTRYYYDACSKSCKKFFYGGCRGNANNFETLECCEKACKKKC